VASDVAPVAPEYFPPGHAVLMIVVGQKYPAGHVVSDDDPSAQYDPDEHGSGICEPVGQYEPAGHLIGSRLEEVQ